MEGRFGQDDINLHHQAENVNTSTDSTIGDRQAGVCNVGGLIHQAIKWYASAMCILICSAAICFFVQSIQAAAFLHDSTSKDIWDGLGVAARTLIGNFAMPFSETLALVVTGNFESIEEGIGETMSVSVWSFWMPMLLGTMFVLYGSSGYLTIKLRRIGYLLPFTGLAVMFLVWQVESSQMLTQMAYEEKLEINFNQTHLQLNPSHAVNYEMFKTSYAQFLEVLDSAQCTVSYVLDKPYETQPMQLKCKRDSMDAHLVQMAVTQFCIPKTRRGVVAKHFNERVEVCKTQGRTLQILPINIRAREEAFCRCRSTMYDCLQVASRWCMVLWSLQLVGVCGVVYLGIEPNLQKMGTKERRDLLCFAMFGIAVLVGRVAFCDGAFATMQHAIEVEN